MCRLNIQVVSYGMPFHKSHILTVGFRYSYRCFENKDQLKVAAFLAEMP